MRKSISRIKAKVLGVTLLAMFLVFSMMTPLFAMSSDIQGHWAEASIKSWMEKGYVKGYANGSFKPDNQITRAEFMTLINKAFSFSKKAVISYKDVADKDWFAGEVAKVKAAGYINGYPDNTIKPNHSISRQEAAVILSKVLGLNDSKNDDALSKFKDEKAIAAWSKQAVEAIVAAGIMSGYPNSTYQPQKSITRAEAVLTLDRSLSSKEVKNAVMYDKAGTYGPEKDKQTVEGNVVVKAAGVTLQNMVITGDLILDEGIGEGDVFVKNTTVKGNTIVKGGGKNSIHFENTVMVTVIVDKRTGDVRIVAEGATTVQQVRLQSGAILQESNISAAGFSDVVLSQIMPQGSQVTLQGTFETVDVVATSISLQVPNGTINQLNVDAQSAQANINLGNLSRVLSLAMSGAAAVNGQGVVERAVVNANGASFENRPSQLQLGQGVTTTAGGQTVNNSTTSSGSGGNSSGGNDNEDRSNDVTTGDMLQVKITPGSAHVKFNRAITGESYNDFTVTAKLNGVNYPLEDLTYHPQQKRFTFASVPLTDNLGKTFEVTVSSAPGTDKFAGGSTGSITIHQGFEGRITDVDSQGVSGLTIKFRSGVGNTAGEVVKTVTTGENGFYNVVLPPAIYTGEITGQGFIMTHIVAVSASDEYNTQENATAIRVANDSEIRIVLKWAEHPRDLDSHLVGPGPNGEQFHTWYSDEQYYYNGTLYADLDWDDTQSYGPETTTIRQQTNGTYKFYVHHYAGESTLRKSSAVVEVYKGSSTQPIKTYQVPEGEGTELYWTVFEMDINQGQLEFREINALTDDERVVPGEGENTPPAASTSGDSVVINPNLVEGDGQLTSGDTVTVTFSEPLWNEGGAAVQAIQSAVDELFGTGKATVAHSRDQTSFHIVVGDSQTINLGVGKMLVIPAGSVADILGMHNDENIEFYIADSDGVAPTTSADSITLLVNQVPGDQKLTTDDTITVEFSKPLYNENNEAVEVVQAAFDAVFGEEVVLVELMGDEVTFQIVVLPEQTLELLEEGTTVTIRPESIRDTSGTWNEQDITFVLSDNP